MLRRYKVHAPNVVVLVAGRSEFLCGSIEEGVYGL
jgi:hypothetical protein